MKTKITPSLKKPRKAMDLTIDTPAPKDPSPTGKPKGVKKATMNKLTKPRKTAEAKVKLPKLPKGEKY